MKRGDIESLRDAGSTTGEHRHRIIGHFCLKSERGAAMASEARTKANPVLVRSRVRHPVCGFVLPLLILTLAGCRTASVAPPLADHPKTYRRVAVLPICFDYTCSAHLATSTGNSEASRLAGAQLALGLTNQLTRKGYQVVGPVRVLHGEDDWSTLDLASGAMLRQQFDLERIRPKCGETNFLYSGGFVSSLPGLLEKLRLPEADAVLLLECWEGYESSIRPMPHSAFNDTLMTFLAMSSMLMAGNSPKQVGDYFEGGTSAPSGPLIISKNFCVYVFDLRTQGIIYSASRTHSGKRPDRAVRALLGPLPKIK